MKLTFARNDQVDLKEMKRLDVLLHCEGNRLDQQQGVILVKCGDGDQTADIFKYTVKMMKGQRRDPRIHDLSWNGGALLMARKSRAKRRHSSHIDPFENIRKARAMKGIDTVALHHHFPCGVAQSNGWSLVEVIDRLMRAKANVKADNEGVRVACFIQIHYPRTKRKRRSFFVWREAWDLYIKQYRRGQRASLQRAA